VGEKLYRNTKAALQKLLGVTSKATARELCIQFGCARHDASVRAALAAYKERFVRSLPAVQQGHVDFGRPVFLAAAFFLVARKHKVAVSACLPACLPARLPCLYVHGQLAAAIRPYHVQPTASYHGPCPTLGPCTVMPPSLPCHHPHCCQVDRMKLLGPLGVTATEFAQVPWAHGYVYERLSSS